MLNGLMRPRKNFLDIFLKCIFSTKTKQHITQKNTIPSGKHGGGRIILCFPLAGTGTLIRYRESWWIQIPKYFLAQNLQASAIQLKMKRKKKKKKKTKLTFQDNNRAQI